MESQTRQAATLKAVKIRMRSVQNIQKITKAMKMVAAAKLRGDERNMRAGQPFVKPVKELMQRLPREDRVGPVSIWSVTSDKGLCGGVNSAVGKLSRNTLIEEEAKGNSVKLNILGGKGISVLKRLYGDRFGLTLEELAKIPFNYTTASIIADRICASNPDRLKLVSNQFKSMAVYNTVAQDLVTLKDVQEMNKAEWSKAMDVYSFEPSIYEVWQDLHEFYYGAVIYGAQLEASTSEQSARMSAMDNAAKNAGEMLEKLSMIYNRARQAKITTELCEIISGASAV